MKNIALFTLAVGLLVAVGTSGAAQGFAEVPPTIGAYTLRGGEWQIGAGMGLPLTPPHYWVANVSLAHGISHWLQVGAAVSHRPLPDPLMVYRGHAKLRLPLGVGFDLGIPFGFSFVDQGWGVQFGSVHSSAVVSLRLGVGLTLHSGATLWVTRDGEWHIRPHAIADFDILPNLKLVGEFGFSPLRVVEVGAWIRVFPFLDVNVALDPLARWFTGGVYLRF